MKNGKRAAVVALSAVLACASLAGCDRLTTVNTAKDYAQIIAEVDLTASEDYAAGGTFAAYRDLVETGSISKRDLIMSYLSSGYSIQQQYGWSYQDIFEMIIESLVNRQIFVQYSKTYLAQNGAGDDKYTVDGYKAAMAGDFPCEEARVAAGLAYFLTADEKSKADYDLRVSINGQIDTYEEAIIDFEEDHAHTADSDVRTLPTGAETEDAEYFDVNYRIYTGAEAPSALGTYEKPDGSTASTRKRAYEKYLASLRSNNLLEEGEDTSNFESLRYFALEQKSAYETAVINKVMDLFEDEAEKDFRESWVQEVYEETLNTQKETYNSNKSTFETDLNAMSDSKFVLAAPQSEDASGNPVNDAYGFVINILLPFSATQSAALDRVSNDLGDEKGNVFAARANLLRGIRATDQRGTWFTGHEDYSFAADENAYKGAGDRNYLFFENGLKNSSGDDARYEPLKNYYGEYTFNGAVEKDAEGEYTITPEKITIDGFLGEMKGYLEHIGLPVAVETKADPEAYYANEDYYYTADAADGSYRAGDVDYSKFIYETGKIEYFKTNQYNANDLFYAGSKENDAFSVINELSFAYNTDTAGLNSYLGYMISPYKTSFMSEFEYAAQIAVANGAGSYAVIPTDYGWHIIYCTFSFADAETPFNFVYEDRNVEGKFSNLYFEQMKSETLSDDASRRQTEAINKYADDCVKQYTDRWKDLADMDNA